MVDSGCAIYRIHFILCAHIFVGKVSFNKYDKNDKVQIHGSVEKCTNYESGW